MAATLFAASAAPRDDTQAAWENLQRLKAGQRVHVDKKSHDEVAGTFVSSSNEAINVTVKRQDLVIPRAEVRSVRLGGRSRRSLWIGLAVGAGAGAVLGAAIAERLANESGGDFAGLKPAVTAASAGVGAVIGLAIGAAVGGRHTTIYKVK